MRGTRRQCHSITTNFSSSYKVAVDEYRFEVKLGWDRAMYYMVFNTAIISVGTGLLKLEDPPLGSG